MSSTTRVQGQAVRESEAGPSETPGLFHPLTQTGVVWGELQGPWVRNISFRLISGCVCGARAPSREQGAEAKCPCGCIFFSTFSTPGVLNLSWASESLIPALSFT